MPKKNPTLKQFSSWFSLAVTVALIANTLFLLSIQQAFYDVITMHQHRQSTMALMEELREETEQLTLLVRAYTSTGQTHYLTYYYDILAVRQGEKPQPENYEPGVYWDRLIASQTPPAFTNNNPKQSLTERMQSLGFSAEEFKAFDEVSIATESMKQIEQIAFAATQGLYDPQKKDFISDGKPQPEFANQLVHSQQYNQLKANLSDALITLISKVNERTDSAVTHAEDNLQHWIFFALGNLLFTLALMFMASRIIRRRVIRPIQILSEVTDKLAHGDYSARTGIDLWQKSKREGSVEELMNLGRVFNSMAEAIEGDIAQQIKAKQALERANEKIEEATRAKSMFLANMSHEIRTPMNAIIGMAYLALKTELTPRQKNYITEIHNASKSLLHIINDILDFSKVEAGKIELEQSPFSLEEVVTNTLSLLRQRAQEKELELLLSMTSPLLVNPDKWLLGDPLRLSQVLINLLSNSIKFTHQGYVKLTIDIDEHRDNQIQLRFSLCDTGIGMTAEQTGRLFQEFTQGDESMTRKYGGTGLGLSIAKKLVELMQGNIRVESESNQGTCFIFTACFPVIESSVADGDLLGLNSLRLLVVDDRREACQVLVDLLRVMKVGTASKQHLVSTSSGKNALTLLKEATAAHHPFDVLFLDWVMADMDGGSVLRRLHDSDITPHPTIVIVSAYDSDMMHEMAAEFGVKFILSKPVLPDALRQLFKQLQHGEAEQAVEVASISTISLQGMRLLLVEDNSINQHLAVELLTNRGAQVTVTENGQEALNRLASVAADYYQVVLMDLQMPVMDGYEATRRLREDKRYAQLPVIAMTAHAMSEERQRCLALGMNGHLTKPIEPDDLYRLLSNYYHAPAERQDIKIIAPAPTCALTLPNIEGLNAADGLRRTANNQTLYLDVLSQFVDDFADCSDLFTAHIDNAEWQDAERLAHVLKSLAGSLGAKTVAAAALTLEAACQSRQTEAALTALADMRQVLTPLIVALRQFFSTEKTATPAAQKTAASELITDALPQLLALLHEGDSTALDFWESYLPAFKLALPPQTVVHVTAALQNFDFDAAHRLLTTSSTQPRLNGENK